MDHGTLEPRPTRCQRHAGCLLLPAVILLDSRDTGSDPRQRRGMMPVSCLPVLGKPSRGHSSRYPRHRDSYLLPHKPSTTPRRLFHVPHAQQVVCLVSKSCDAGAISTKCHVHEPKIRASFERAPQNFVRVAGTCNVHQSLVDKIICISRSYILNPCPVGPPRDTQEVVRSL